MANQVEQQGIGKAQASKPRALGKGFGVAAAVKATGGRAHLGCGRGGSRVHRQALEIDVELIDRNPFQTRTNFDEAKLAELATSIIASGVVQPIVVRHGVNHRTDGRLHADYGRAAVAGEQESGQGDDPGPLCARVSNLQAMEMTIVENLQRADLNPMEQAHAYVRLSRDFT